MGGNGNDTIIGNNGDDTIYDYVGNNNIYGGIGYDRVDTGDGIDNVIADSGGGCNVIYTGYESDTIFVKTSSILSGAGNDFIYSLGIMALFKVG